ncbi:MAG: RNA 3'-terminal phosphate cyclase [Desulfurococcaceae archaeon]
MERVLEIDGSIGEGGGQVLRYSLALSVLTLRPLRIYNIRAKRDNPGLRPQHLTAVRALQELSDAVVRGDRVGSTELYFEPRARLAGNYKFDVGTAGSVSLVLQAIMPALLFAEARTRVEISGGTDVRWSPPIDYLRTVFVHNIALMGATVRIDVVRRGYYPRGGGLVEARVEPLSQPLAPIEAVGGGRPLFVRGISHAANLPRHVAERQASSAREILARELGLNPEIQVEHVPRALHTSPGSGIVLYAELPSRTMIGADSLGERGKPAEAVGGEAAKLLVEEARSGAAFDRHMGDMLVPYMFLAAGKSRIDVSSLTLHTLTAIEISKMFFRESSAEVLGGLGTKSTVIIRGVGYRPNR